MPQLELDAAVGDRAVEREAEFALRVEPHRIERIAGVAQIAEHAEEILPDEMPEHEAVVQRGAPAHQRAMLRLAPEPGDQRAQQKLLRQAHARVRRHLERAEFDEAEPAGRPVGREQLVDADFGAMGVAGDVDQEIAEQPIDEPRPRRSRLALPGAGTIESAMSSS